MTKHSFKFYMNLCKQLSEGKITKEKAKDILGPIEYGKFIRDYYENYQTLKLSNINLMKACYQQNIIQVGRWYDRVWDSVTELNKLMIQAKSSHEHFQKIETNPEYKIQEALNFIKLTERSTQLINQAIDVAAQKEAQLDIQKQKLEQAVKQADELQLLRFLNIL